MDRIVVVVAVVCSDSVEDVDTDTAELVLLRRLKPRRTHVVMVEKRRNWQVGFFAAFFFYFKNTTLFQQRVWLIFYSCNQVRLVPVDLLD